VIPGPRGPRPEVVEDLLGIVQTFSWRLYGLRRYEKELKRGDLTMEGDR
jgi:putative resolvase